MSAGSAIILLQYTSLPSWGVKRGSPEDSKSRLTVFKSLISIFGSRVFFSVFPFHFQVQKGVQRTILKSLTTIHPAVSSKSQVCSSSAWKTRSVNVYIPPFRPHMLLISESLSFQSCSPDNNDLHVIVSLLKSLLKKYTAHDRFQ